MSFISFEICCNVSGYRPDDLKIDLEENCIIIQGSFKDVRPGESIHRHFTHRFDIPEGIDHQTIKCDLDEAGILSLHGGKKVITVKKRSIPIGAKPLENEGNELKSVEFRTRPLVSPLQLSYAAKFKQVNTLDVKAENEETSDNCE